MTADIVRGNTPLSQAWANVAEAALHQPQRYLARLCEHSERDRWELSQLDWASVDLTEIPLPLRQLAAGTVAQLQFGELTAMMGAARLVQEAPSPAVQAFACRQVEEESRHLSWFSRVLQKLECQGEVADSVVAFMEDVHAAPTIEAHTLGVNILVEGMAHSFFVRAAKIFGAIDMGGEAALVAPFRSMQVVAARWLPEYLGRDEARHIAFGVSFLRERLAAMDGAERDALESSVQRWSAMFAAAANASDVLVVPGMDGPATLANCVEDVNLRIAQIGLDSRIALPERA